MLLAQEGVCAICKLVCASGNYLSVDHDHNCCPSKTSCGRCVRGLLCRDCNWSISKLNDDPKLLRAAALYIERYY